MALSFPHPSHKETVCAEGIRSHQSESHKEVCCWYLLQDNFREEEILVLKNNWQPNAYCFFLVLVFLPFCLHLYCLFPFFYLLFAFQLRDLSSISPKLSPAPVPACLGPPAQSLQSLSQSVSVLLAAQLWLTLLLPDPLQRQEGHCCLQHPHCKSHPSWRLPVAEPARAGGMLRDQLCSYLSTFLSTFSFCLLPCSGPGSSSSVPARYLTAPACGSRGSYSKRSGKTHMKATRAPEPARPALSFARRRQQRAGECSAARVCGLTRRGIRQKAWLRLFLYNPLCPSRENQPYYSISKYIEKWGQGSKWSVTFAQLGRNKSQACTICYTQQISAQRLFFGRLKGKGFPGYLTC